MIKLVRYHRDGETHYGSVEGNTVIELEGADIAALAQTGRRIPLDSVRLRAPVVPGKVVCVGKNYVAHCEEFGTQPPEEPCLFIKPSTAVIGPGDTILYPAMSSRVDYEAELAAVIARPLRNASPGEAREAVLGFTCLNDVTARDLQAKDGQWTRAKGFDTFCPMGPWVVSDLDPDGLEIELLLNGERKQHSNTDRMVCKTFDLISFISRVMTLLPGDVVATGTPEGVGPMMPGDTVEVRIEGIGSLRNIVAKP